MNKNSNEYQAYLDQRENLNKSEYSVSEKYDHWLISLSAGALAISLTFIKDIAPNPDKSTIIYLILSWLFLLISILSSVYSLLTSQSAIRRAREILDDNYENNDKSNNSKPDNKYAKTTNFLNHFSMLSFTLGVILLCTFSIINMYERSALNERQEINTCETTTERCNKKGICTTDTSKTAPKIDTR